MRPITATVIGFARLLQFYIPGAVAELAVVEIALLRNVALPMLAAGDAIERHHPASRFSYRFGYRLSRGHPEYRCRITASSPLQESINDV
jgi:hypothetical protein